MDIYVFVAWMRWIAVRHRRVTWDGLRGWVWIGMDWGVVLDDGWGWYKGLDSSLCSE